MLGPTTSLEMDPIQSAVHCHWLLLLFGLTPTSGGHSGFVFLGCHSTVAVVGVFITLPFSTIACLRRSTGASLEVL